MAEVPPRRKKRCVGQGVFEEAATETQISAMNRPPRSKFAKWVTITEDDEHDYCISNSGHVVHADHPGLEKKTVFDASTWNSESKYPSAMLLRTCTSGGDATDGAGLGPEKGVAIGVIPEYADHPRTLEIEKSKHRGTVTTSADSSNHRRLLITSGVADMLAVACVEADGVAIYGVTKLLPTRYHTVIRSSLSKVFLSPAFKEYLHSAGIVYDGNLSPSIVRSYTHNILTTRPQCHDTLSAVQVPGTKFLRDLLRQGTNEKLKKSRGHCFPIRNPATGLRPNTLSLPLSPVIKSEEDNLVQYTLPGHLDRRQTEISRLVTIMKSRWPDMIKPDTEESYLQHVSIRCMLLAVLEDDERSVGLLSNRTFVHLFCATVHNYEVRREEASQRGDHRLVKSGEEATLLRKKLLQRAIKQYEADTGLEPEVHHTRKTACIAHVVSGFLWDLWATSNILTPKRINKELKCMANGMLGDP